MLKVYLETTIPSYLTARPSRDLIIAARQQMTREWWEGKRDNVDLYISDFVLAEVEEGDGKAAQERAVAIEGLPVLETNAEIIDLGVKIAAEAVFPEKVMPDAFHLACATVHGIDVLLTWNCRHLANPDILVKLNKYIMALGYVPPIVCTPEEMLEEE